jgi:predicted transcriptional regulator
MKSSKYFKEENMMEDEKKISYPMLPPKNWWALRKKFQLTMPTKVTTGYLAPVLKITETSAKNVLPFLKSMGLIDDEGKTTPLVNKWRFDETYAEVCEEIRKKIYPQELLDALPNPEKDREATKNWFAAKTKSGALAASRMANLYILLSEADPSKGEELSRSLDREKKPKPLKKTPTKIKKDQILEIQQNLLAQNLPSIHFNIQFHLSPETTADQIDQIFASMAKHLKDMYQSPKKSE